MHNHVHTAPQSPSERCGRQISQDLEGVILQCLEKDPERRPQSAEQLSDLLAACRAAQAWGRQDAREWWRQFKARNIESHSGEDSKLDLSVEVDLADRQ